MPKQVATQTVVSIPVQLLCRAHITPTQYAFLYLLHSKDTRALTAYVNANKGFPRHEVKDLYERGFILYFDVNKEVETHPDNLYVTEKFTDLLYDVEGPLVDDDDAFNELFTAYPAYIDVNGQKVSARSLDVDAYCDYYARILKGNREEHARILEDLAYAKEHNILNMGLKKFLESRNWLGIRALRESGFQGSTFDNAETI